MLWKKLIINTWCEESLIFLGGQSVSCVTCVYLSDLLCLVFMSWFVPLVYGCTCMKIPCTYAAHVRWPRLPWYHFLPLSTLSLSTHTVINDHVVAVWWEHFIYFFYSLLLTSQTMIKGVERMTQSLKKRVLEVSAWLLYLYHDVVSLYFNVCCNCVVYVLSIWCYVHLFIFFQITEIGFQVPLIFVSLSCWISKKFFMHYMPLVWLMHVWYKWFISFYFNSSYTWNGRCTNELYVIGICCWNLNECTHVFKCFTKFIQKSNLICDFGQLWSS